MQYEKYLKGQLEKSSGTPCILTLFFSLYNGSTRDIFINEDPSKETQMKNDFFDGKEYIYEGSLTKEDIFKAIDNHYCVMVAGMFYYIEERKELLEYAKSKNAIINAVIDTLPFYYSRPIEANDNTIKEEFKTAKENFSLPLYAEGFNEITIYELDADSFIETYSISNFTLRNFEKFASDNLALRLPIINGVIAAKFAMANKTKSLDTLMCFLAYIGLEEKGFIINNSHVGYNNISSIDFYAYAHNLLECFYRADYSRQELYDVMVALNKFTLYDNEFLEKNKLLFENTKVYDKIMLLKKATSYVKKIEEEQKEVFDSPKSVYKMLEEFFEYLKETLNDEMNEARGGF